MSKKIRYTLIVIASVVLLFFIGLISANLILKNKIERFITQQLPPHMQADYQKIDLDLLAGTVTCSDVSLKLQNKSDERVHTIVTSEKITIKDVNYWDYVFNKQITIEAVNILSPDITYHKNRLVQRTDTSSQDGPISARGGQKPVLIKQLDIDDARLNFYDGSADSTALHVQDLTLTLDSIFFSRETLKKRMPVTYQAYEASADSIFVKVSPYENLTVGAFAIENRNVRIRDMLLQTKYSKSEHAQLLSKERDHFNVHLDSLMVHNIDFGFNNRKFYATSNHIALHQAQATIYRNKLVANDNTTKPLYSKMLRDLPIDLTIDSLQLTNSSLIYEEKVKQDHPAGSIHFDNFNANMQHVSNTYTEGTKTKIMVTSQFMGTAPIEVDWTFDVNDTSDAFTFKADIGTLPAPRMNSFTEPNLGVRLEGEAVKTYFSVYGNKSQSEIDMRIDYEDFKVNVLQDDGRKKKGLISGIVNIFVHKNSNDNDDGAFSKGNATVTPDRTKSFFNYLWLNMRAALKDALL